MGSRVGIFKFYKSFRGVLSLKNREEFSCHRICHANLPLCLTFFVRCSVDEIQFYWITNGSFTICLTILKNREEFSSHRICHANLTLWLTFSFVVQWTKFDFIELQMVVLQFVLLFKKIGKNFQVIEFATQICLFV